MDKVLCDFTKIGLNLTEPYSDDIARISNNVDLNNKLQKEYEETIETHDSDYESDNELSIEGLSDDLNNIRRNYKLSLSLIDSLNKDTKALAESIYVDSNKIKPMEIIYKNICKENPPVKIKTSWIYKNPEIDKMFYGYKSLRNVLKYLDPAKPDTYIQSFKYLDKYIVNFLLTLVPNLYDSNYSFFNSLNNLNYYIDKHDYKDNESWKLVIASIYKLIKNNSTIPININKVIYNTNCIFNTHHACELISLCNIKLFNKDIKLLDEENMNNLSILLYFYSSYIKGFSLLLLDIVKDIQTILSVIEPLSSKDIDKSDTYMSDIENINPWISADYHILKEYRKGEMNSKRSEDIISMHNHVVKKDDVFLFLGDITESEYFETSSNSHLKEVISIVKRLNGHKILITGNNDTGTDSLYKEMGFEEIYHSPIETKNFIFSHGPIKTDGKLNIHGHIHGSKEYFDIDYHNHIDCYFGLWGRPVKLSELQKFYKTGMYKDCKTIKPSYTDPETKLKPQEIK